MNITKTVFFYGAIAILVLNIGIIFMWFNGTNVPLIGTGSSEIPTEDEDPTPSLCQKECTIFNENVTDVTGRGCKCICETVSVNICKNPPAVVELDR